MHLLGRPTTISTDIKHALRKAEIFKKTEVHSWTTIFWVAYPELPGTELGSGWEKQHDWGACGWAEQKDTQKHRQGTMQEGLGYPWLTGFGAVHDWDPRARVTEGPSALSSFNCPTSYRILASCRPACLHNGTCWPVLNISILSDV